jgi:HAE1 family hydrophobic/amphiphilic exporter-1
MHISELSIRRPVFAWMLMVSLILFGAIGYYRMGVSQYPDIDFPYVSIQLVYDGAAPEVMEKDVIDPVEGAIVSIQGIKNISSKASNGRASVSVEFELDKDVDVAVQEIQTAIARAQRNLPDDIEPPIITKANIEDQPIMWMAVRSDKLSREQLMYLVRGQIRDQISTVSGVSEVILGGYVEPALRVNLDAAKLQRYQFSVDDIINSIQREHKEEPAGRLETPEIEQPVRVMGEAANVEEFNKVIIKRRGGGPNYAPVAIAEVAEVKEGLNEVRRMSRVQGETAVGIGIRKQRGSNAVDVGKAIKKKAAELQKQLPEGVQLSINFDTTPYISETVHELLFTILMAALLTAIVCWAFLGSISSTINVLLAIPTSIIGAFWIMQAFGFTLNTFSLLGLSLAIGIVVDDAIIVLENIMRHNEMGKNRLRAAVEGSKEISFAVLATTFSLVAIFLPVAFLQGIIGKFFFQFAVTLCVAVLLSCLEALTLAPMRCSQFLATGQRTTKLGRWFEWMMESGAARYSRALPFFLLHRWKTLIATVIFFAASMTLLKFIPKEFTPAQDEGNLFVQVKAKQGASMAYTDVKMREIEKIVMEDPNVERYFCGIGGFSGGESNVGFVFITLKDRKVRALRQDKVAEGLREKLKAVKDVKAFIPSGSGGVFGGGSNYAVNFGVRGPDWDKLGTHAEEIVKQMNDSGKFTDVQIPDVKGAPEIHVVPDREAALRFGVEISEIARAVRVMVGGFPAALYAKGGLRYDVIVQLREADRKTVDHIKSIRVRNTRGELIQLDKLVKIENRLTAPTITRENRVRSVNISANPAKGIAQEKALEDAQLIAKKVLPEGYFVALSGSSEEMKNSFYSLMFAMIMGILVAYMVLGSQFNSFIDPLVVLAALPFAFTGALFGLLAANQSLNVYSFIGIILLIGIVKKNSILLVDFTNQMRDTGLPVDQALVKACPQRLRPILMTTFATLAGALPGAINFGPGSETRVPMSVVVIGGVMVSTFFTLFVVPCLYSVTARARRKFDLDSVPDHHERRRAELSVH